jgi:hypothetical protein
MASTVIAWVGLFHGKGSGTRSSPGSGARASSLLIPQRNILGRPSRWYARPATAARAAMAALSRVSEIPRMEVGGEKDQRHVDGGQVAREPAGQVDVRDRAALAT